MFGRLTFFTLGVAVGAGGTVYGYFRARELARERIPDSVQDAAGRMIRRADAEVREVVDRSSTALATARRTAHEMRDTRRDAEWQLRAELERAGL